MSVGNHRRDHSIFQGAFVQPHRRSPAPRTGEEIRVSGRVVRYVACQDGMYDMAVEFEDARTSIQALQAAGISISKLQLSSAMRIAEVGPETAQRLQAFVEPVYLHQVVEQGPDGLRRYTDLPDALAKIEAAMGREWRIHFHVPIFLDKMAEVGTTQGFLRDILAIQRDTPVTQQLEVETYTWDVLPETYRNIGVSAAIARELTWVRDQLAP